MTLIKSISGIRGTIGGNVGDNLTPIDTVKFASAYGTWLKSYRKKETYKVVIGRDARPSGKMIQELVINSLIGLGIDVVSLELSTTPTVEMAVKLEHADGGIIVTASHNPVQWNALKLLNEKGEFLNDKDGKDILNLVETGGYNFSEVQNLGNRSNHNSYIDLHIQEILKLEDVLVEKIKQQKFKVVLDAVNSTGGISIVPLLEKLNVEVIKLFCDPTGEFPHNPEPLKKHLTDLSKSVIKNNADFGIAVDPDVDRLAFMDEKGEMYGEEYTLVTVADYILSRRQGNTVSNLSSSRALRDVTEKHGSQYTASAVGEVNVVKTMKDTNAVIGGEGNGGIIYPDLHYGRDSLVGLALFLSHLSQKQMKVSDLRKTYPSYFMAKEKIQLTPQIDVDRVLKKVEKMYEKENLNTIDGVKIDFENSWVHLRKSNTEPIIRIYTEALSQEEAKNLAKKMISEIKTLT
ncbi:phosphoglucosamine mutase [Mesohalobacter halotolerans]|uniref:Phosphoglucosamine mutase n=1 Tax=Mesohalobacter halotolerans TaxID=1883405 RepID=A0A4U5TP44_9FLAO|nr:phosphoglucosamine mutase [Mesohalobacter halotolerans]MBS3739306.1 phosphoglucosamine mutase [Psychroflexus sp.]TKS55869.1 phosphoglucosamine mutase [Mesohalobacter halotolerans]